MARQFGDYSPVVPLGVTWEESITFQDEAGTAIDLTGYAVRAQLREDIPDVDPDTGDAIEDPVLEITTASYYGTAPAWPVLEAFSVPDPTTGTIELSVAAADTWTASPDNAKRKLYWDVRLVNPNTGYAVPVVQGKVAFLPARTV